MIADDLSRIAMSTGLAASLSRATERTRERGHVEVTLEHMLLSLCEDADAGLVLAASNINIAELVSVIDDQLAGVPQHGPVGENELVVSADLRRILEAAAAAARGGRRREINGAIVLAAIIGDGKSAAADALSSLGLTFEGAIRALQSKPAPAASQPDARPLPAPDAEAILAGARERVQSRTVTAPPRRAHAHEGIAEHYEAEPELDAPEPEPHPAPLPPQHEPEPQREEFPTAPPLRSYTHQDTAEHPPAPSRQPPPASHPVTNQPAAYDEHRADTYGDARPDEHDGYHGQQYDHDAQAGGSGYDSPYEEPAYQGHEHHPLPHAPDDTLDRFPPLHDGLQPGQAPPRPSSAPFPPPVRLPDAHDDGWGAPFPDPHQGYAAEPQHYPAARGAAAPPPYPDASGYPPGPPPLAPWPEQPQPPHARQQPGFDPHFPAHEHYPPQQDDWQAEGYPMPAPRAEIGQLVENIPRSMRVAVPALIEVRIARADVKALAEGLQGGGAAYQHELMVTKAMSVRLRAPDGGFYIETASPETQWIDRTALMSSDDFASWRWHVTPRDTGRRRLQLIISARTVSADGLAAETALPDQVVSVRVRTNYAQSTKRWIGWGAAAVAGGLLAKFGEGTLGSLTGLLG